MSKRNRALVSDRELRDMEDSEIKNFIEELEKKLERKLPENVVILGSSNVIFPVNTLITYTKTLLKIQKELIWRIKSINERENNC